MLRRSLAARACLAALVLAPLASGLLAACGDDTVLLPDADGGASADATTPDVSVDSAPEASAEAGDASDAAPTCTPFDAGALDPNAVDAGLQLVGTHKCENCHGSTLSGNKDGVPSTTAMGGFAYPPNLTPDPTTGLGCWTNAQIENAILNGIDNEGMPLCNPMPVFGHIDGGAGLTPAQAALVVAYLRSLPPVSNLVMNTPDCPVPPTPDAGPEAGVDAAPEAGEAGSDAGTEAGAGDAGASDGSANGSDATVDAATPADGGAEAATEAGDDGSTQAAGDAADDGTAATAGDGAADGGGD